VPRLIELWRCRHPLLIAMVLSLPPGRVEVYDGCVIVFDEDVET
jgi:hypothetical protein